MGRGYIYEVSDNINFIGSMGEEDFYEDLSALSVDYVANMDKADQDEMREDFLKTLKSHGAHVQLITDDTLEEFPNGVYAVSNLNDIFKKNFFHERYRRMKTLAESITLQQFSIDSFDTTLYNLKNAIVDDYGDMIYLNSSYETLDYFIRNANPQTTYYIGNVVFMH